MNLSSVWRANEKMSDKHQTPGRSAAEHRLPPGQHLAKTFPVLDLGIQPAVAPTEWTLVIRGEVENPITIDWQQFRSLSRSRNVSDFHCVTKWSLMDLAWEGVAFRTLAGVVHPKSSAAHVFFRGYDGYTTNNSLDVCLDEDVLLADTLNGQPLFKEHGGPVRIIIPKRYAWKGAKFIHEIVFLDREVLGFWELRGYSNSANPWSEERYAPGINNPEADS